MPLAKHSLDLSPILRKSIAQAQKRKSVQRQTESPVAPLRAISRVEKMANRTAWREVLECGHYGELTFGPNHQWIPLKGLTNARRCEECKKSS